LVLIYLINEGFFFKKLFVGDSNSVLILSEKYDINIFGKLVYIK